MYNFIMKGELCRCFYISHIDGVKSKGLAFQFLKVGYINSVKILQAVSSWNLVNVITKCLPVLHLKSDDFNSLVHNTDLKPHSIE